MGALDARLSDQEHLASDCSIADIANFPWAAAARRLLTTKVGAPVFENVERWLDVVGARQAVIAGLSVPVGTI